jgi:hypothetical protein
MPQAIVGAISYAASYAASAGLISGLAAAIVQTPLIATSVPLPHHNAPDQAKEQSE